MKYDYPYKVGDLVVKTITNDVYEILEVKEVASLFGMSKEYRIRGSNKRSIWITDYSLHQKFEPHNPTVKLLYGKESCEQEKYEQSLIERERNCRNGK
jgi:hypothetical protein